MQYLVLIASMRHQGDGNPECIAEMLVPSTDLKSRIREGNPIYFLISCHMTPIPSLWLPKEDWWNLVSCIMITLTEDWICTHGATSYPILIMWCCHPFPCVSTPLDCTYLTVIMRNVRRENICPYLPIFTSTPLHTLAMCEYPPWLYLPQSCGFQAGKACACTLPHCHACASTPHDCTYPWSCGSDGNTCVMQPCIAFQSILRSFLLAYWIDVVHAVMHPISCLALNPCGCLSTRPLLFPYDAATLNLSRACDRLSKWSVVQVVDQSVCRFARLP